MPLGTLGKRQTGLASGRTFSGLLLISSNNLLKDTKLRCSKGELIK